MDERVTAIEMALAHAEAALEDLGDLVSNQDARIRRLEAALAALSEQISAAEAALPGLGTEVPPPHY